MAMYIDADKLSSKLRYLFRAYGVSEVVREKVKEALNKSTADVAEVRHGKWIDRYSEKYDNHLYECSECRKKALYDARGDELGSIKTTQVLSPVCPWCGAKMDE